MTEKPLQASQPGDAEMAKVPARRIRWKATYRLVPTRFPPIDLFERIAPPEDWEALIELEGMTNPRLRQDAGSISKVPKARRVAGPGASIVMAPFTHCSPARPTRFSDGTFGVYYAGHTFRTALKEVAFHMGRFYASTQDLPLEADYRCYKGSIDKTLHDIRKGRWGELLNADISSYAEPQAFARKLRQGGSNGIVYPSVRDVGGECLAAFWPDVVDIPIQERHIALKWDGRAVCAWYDYMEQSADWTAI